MGSFKVQAGWSPRVRHLVGLAVVLALASPLQSVLPAQAAAPSRVSLANPAQAISDTQIPSAAKATLSLSAPLLAETNLAFALSGAGSEAREGRVVVVQRLFGSSWIDVGRTTQSSTGGYSVQTSVSSAGKLTYRAVASAWHGAAALTSDVRVVSVRAPYILLTESTAIAAETVKVTGRLPGVYSRPIVVQRRSGAAWVALVEATTSTTGSYATSFTAPEVGSYEVRVVAPIVTVPKKVRAEYVSPAKTLSVVAQTASLSMPTTLAQSETGTATVTFAPGRAGRAVALQILTSGVWTAMATGEQSGTGTAAFTFTAGTPGSYSYRAWTAAANGAAAFTSPAGVLEVAPALPGPVTDVTATPAGTSVALSWTNPSDPSLTGVMIRRAEGATPPASAAAGTLVTDVAKPAISFVDTTVTPSTQYSYALFAHGAMLGFATAGTVTTATTAGMPPSITGTVTDAGALHHGLANVRVSVYSPATDTVTSVTTVGDGSYAVSGLAPGTDYQVWFYASGATGGSSDALGYLDQAYDNQQPMFGGTPTPVTVTSGATTTAVDAALAAGGAITGTVRDAEGNRHPLVNVSVSVSSPSNGNYYGYAKTAADGSYAVQGMPAGTDYQVCFFATGATGGSADALGYLDQCFDNQSTMGTPTPVAVTLGEARVGVDAALPVAGGVSGTVTDAGGTKHGLANVSVQVYSPSNFGYANATTAADGTYTATGLAAGTDYQVCFYASGAIGGSSDATGYLDQCYDNQPTMGTPTPVAVTLGAAGAGTNAALTGGGAVSGTVSDAGGSRHGLADVWVSVASPSLGVYVSATTAADGSYRVTGLAAGTDYTVCFSASGATGGSSDTTGYLDQCYDGQTMPGTPTPVTVTEGATRSAVDAALGVGVPQ